MERNNKKTLLIVITAMMTAVTILCTAILRVPVDADCYIHLGDAILFLSVMILPRKYACFAGPVGAATADLLAGFAFWVPWSFCIKLMMVLSFGAFVDKAKKSVNAAKEFDATQNASASGHKLRKIAGIPAAEFIGFVIACLFNTCGYFLAERILFGNWISALTCVPFNVLQGLLGAVVAVIVSNSLAKTNLKDIMYYKR